MLIQVVLHSEARFLQRLEIVRGPAVARLGPLQTSPRRTLEVALRRRVLKPILKRHDPQPAS